METINIRKATPSDLPVLLQFEQGVVEAERPFDVTLKQTHIQYYDLQALLTNPDSVVMVAEINESIVGSGYARIEKSKAYLQHERHAYLGFMYVHPDQRGKGINQLIIESLTQWSVEQGIRELRLDVYHKNTGAIKAYEKAGFQKLLVEMRMAVSPDTKP